jgi:hypothetical protein
MHVRHARAAVATDAAPSQIPSTQQRHTAASPVLWATRPLAVRAGRLVAVRLRDGTVEVAYVSSQATALRWVRPMAVMTEAQAEVWRRTSDFVAR